MGALDELRAYRRASRRRERNRAFGQLLLAAVVGGVVVAVCLLGFVALAGWSP